jgi:hypothetical protein
MNDILIPTTRTNWTQKLKTFIKKRKAQQSAGHTGPYITEATMLPSDIRRLTNEARKESNAR